MVFLCCHFHVKELFLLIWSVLEYVTVSVTRLIIVAWWSAIRHAIIWNILVNIQCTSPVFLLLIFFSILNISVRDAGFRKIWLLCVVLDFIWHPSFTFDFICYLWANICFQFSYCFICIWDYNFCIYILVYIISLNQRKLSSIWVVLISITSICLFWIFNLTHICDQCGFGLIMPHIRLMLCYLLEQSLWNFCGLLNKSSLTYMIYNTYKQRYAFSFNQSSDCNNRNNGKIKSNKKYKKIKALTLWKTYLNHTKIWIIWIYELLRTCNRKLSWLLLWRWRYKL